MQLVENKWVNEVFQFVRVIIALYNSQGNLDDNEVGSYQVYFDLLLECDNEEMVG